MTSDSQSLTIKPSGHVQADLKELGKYRIVRRIGAGGMGTVYLAEDTLLGRTVALKVLPKERAENPTLIRRFQSEARASAMLTHDNIVSVYDADQADGYLYIALEYIDGIDLHEWLKKRERIPVKRSINIIKQVAAALQHAHEKKLVHRDIKPANIMIAKDGTVKLADMGLARSLDETLDTTITRAGTTVGTVDYMSPEQAANSKHADIRSDIYSLGCTWFHMLTGSPPYPEGDLTNKLRAHSEKPLPDPQDVNDSVSEALVAVIHRMMAKKKQDRYQTPNELLEDLNNTPNLEADSNQLLARLLAEEADEESVSYEESDESLDFIVQEESQAKLLKQNEDNPAPSTSLNVPERTQKKKNKQPKSSAEISKKQLPPKRAREEKQSDELPEQELPAQRQPLKRVRSAEELHEPEPIPQTPRKRKSVEEKPVVTKTTKKKSTPQKKQNPQIKQHKSQKEKSPDKSGTAKRKKAPLKSKALDQGSSTPAKSAPLAISFDWKTTGSVLVGVGVVIALIYWGYSKLNEDSETPIVNPYGDLTKNGAEENAPNLQQLEGQNTPDGTAGKGKENQSGRPHVNEIRNEQESPAPRWVIADRERPQDTNTETFRVQRGQTGRYIFLNLGEAIQAVGERPGLIEFSDEAYEDLQPTKLSLKNRLTIQGRRERPVLTYRPQLGKKDDRPKPWIQVQGGTLELIGLDFILSNPSEHPLAFLDLDGTDLILRDCTFTSLANASTTLASIQGQSKNGNRVLIENCLIRGQWLTAVDINHVSCDLYCDHSLLVSNKNALVRVGLAAKDKRQQLQVSNCTFCGGSAGLQFVNQDDADPPGVCGVEWQRSISIGKSLPCAAIQLVNIPSKQAKDHISLKTQHVLFFNQPVLTEVVRETIPIDSVSSVEQWQAFWNAALPSGDFIEFQEMDKLFSQPEFVTAAKVNERLKEKLEPGAGERSLLGAEPETVATVEVAAIERQQSRNLILNQTEQHKPAAWDGKTLRFDLKQAEKFAAFLRSPECPDGSTVVCFGAGLRTFPPVTLKNRKLRIRFEQSAGTALKVSSKSAGQTEPMFLVDGGFLQIENARFELRSTNTDSPRPIFLETRQTGTIRLVRSQVSQVFNKPNRRALFAFEPNTTSKHNLLSFESSMISSPGPLISLDTTNQSIQLSNSVLVSGANGVALKGNSPTGFIHADFSTFSISKAVFSIPKSTPPLPILVSNSVFAPSVTNSDQSAILGSESLETLRDSVQWWEESCAFAPQIRTPVFVPDERLPGSFAVAWKTFCGPHHIASPLYGPQAILFEKKIEDANTLTPQNFQIAGSSQSAIWSATGDPIGAKLSGIGPQEKQSEKPKNQNTRPGQINTPKGF